MQRELNTYLSDIIDAIRKIEKYTTDLCFNDFIEDELVQDGVVRNLEVIGEAVKKIPEDVRRDKPQIDWRKVAGLRDILIHEYFAVDFEIIWDVVKNKIPELRKIAINLLEELKK